MNSQQRSWKVEVTTALLVFVVVGLCAAGPAAPPVSSPADAPGICFSEHGKPLDVEPLTRLPRSWLHPDPTFGDLRVGGLSLEVDISGWPCLYKRSDSWSARRCYRPWRHTPPHGRFGYIAPAPIPMKRHFLQTEDKVFSEFRPESRPPEPVVQRDWVHASYHYDLDDGQTMDLTVSRLTPAVRVEYSGPRLLLFASNWQTTPIAGRGDKEASQIPMSKRLRKQAEDNPDGFHAPVLHADVAPRINYPNITIDYVDTCTHPSRVAFAAGDGVKVASAVEPLDAAAMSEPWMLVWFEGGSPLPFESDCPFLLVLQHKPQTVRCGKDGLELTFAGRCGNVMLLPLRGMDHPPISETAQWATAVPGPIVEQCRFWAARLLDYPQTVREEGRWDPAVGRAEIAGQITWVSIADDWKFPRVRWAAVPAWASVAAAGLPVEIDGEIERAPAADLLGPPAGVRDADGYVIRLGSIRKYVTERPVFDRPKDEALTELLSRQVAEVVDSPPFAPGYIVTGHPYDILWRNSSETVLALLAARPFVDEAMRGKLDGYLRQWVAQRHPVLRPRQAVTDGQRREWHQMPQVILDREGGDTGPNEADGLSVYALWAYADATGDWQAVEAAWAPVGQVIRGMLQQCDWAAGYLGGIDKLNVQIAGAIGYTRMAEHLGKTTEAQLGALLAGRLMATRLAFSRLAEYVALPDAADRFSKRLMLNAYQGLPQRPFGPAQVYAMDTYGPVLGMHSAYEGGRMPQRLAGLTPAVARLLADFDAQATRAYLEAAFRDRPLWYISDGPNTVAPTTTMMHPGYTWQLFQAQSYILRRPADELKAYLDSPLMKADLYYLANLTAVLAADAGQTWAVAE